MAKYNYRMNSQIFNAIKNLTGSDINEDRGAYFNSIIGTLNHILVGDIIWLRRLADHSNKYVTLKKMSDLPEPKGLDDILFSDIESVKTTRIKVDLLLCHWLENETHNEDFSRNLEYSNTKNIISRRNFGELLSHLFNHQTHHRGQLTTLLNQLGIDVGVTDFLLEIPDDALMRTDN